MCGLNKYRDALLNAATKGKKMYFKDEGGFYTYKLTKDGKLIDPFELYEYGSLDTQVAATKKLAKEIAKQYDCIAVFE